MAARTALPGSGGTGDTAGDVFHASDLDKLPGGWIGDVQVTSSGSTFTTSSTALGISSPVTVGTSRCIEVTGYVRFGSSVDNDDARVEIQESGTVLAAEIVNMAHATASYGVTVTAIIRPSAGSHTYALFGARQTGSGNVNMVVSSTAPSGILVQDLGPA